MTDTTTRKYLMPATATFMDKEIPAGTREGLANYLEHGTPPGTFLYAVLTNNLIMAALKADSVNKHLLYEYVLWLFDNAPGDSWGSVDKVEKWIATHADAS